jgi:hypothetical protein
MTKKPHDILVLDVALARRHEVLLAGGGQQQQQRDHCWTGLVVHDCRFACKGNGLGPRRPRHIRASP